MANNLHQKFLLLLLVAALTSCRYAEKLEGKFVHLSFSYDNDFRGLIDPIFIKGSNLPPILSDLIQFSDFQFPFDSSSIGSSEALEGATLIQVTELSFWTLSDNGGSSNDTLMQKQNIEACENGQPNVDWISELKVFIKKRGEAREGDLLSSFQKSSSGNCGFTMQLNDSINLLDYLPDYEISTKAKGTPPSEDVYLVGFVGIKYQGEPEGISYQPFKTETELQ